MIIFFFTINLSFFAFFVSRRDQYEMTENEDDNTFSSMFDDVLNDPRREFVNQNNTYAKQNDNYLAENVLQPSMLVTNYEFYDKSCNSDSSDDYAGDSDDCSLWIWRNGEDEGRKQKKKMQSIRV